MYVINCLFPLLFQKTIELSVPRTVLCEERIFSMTDVASPVQYETKHPIQTDEINLSLSNTTDVVNGESDLTDVTVSNSGDGPLTNGHPDLNLPSPTADSG